MNDINVHMPYDSLGRRIGVANNFANFTDAQLSSMKDELGLFMDIPQLKNLRDHYKSSNQKSILLEELYLIDEIFKASIKHSKNAYIYNLVTESNEMAVVYNDFIQKRKATCGDNAPVMSIDDAAKVYPLYSQSIGLISRSIDTQEKESLDENTAFLYLYSSAGYEDYCNSVNEFISSNEFAKLALLAKKIDDRGIAYALASLSKGIYADLHSIKEIAKTPELSHLATEAHGRYIVATSKQNVDKLTALAQIFSLECVYFARAFSNEKFTLRKIGRTQMSLDTSLILRFGNTKCKTTFMIIEEEYVKRQNELVDALLPSVALGASLQNITVSSKYQIPEHSDINGSNGKALSAILGAYRAEVELCVAAAEPTICYEDSENIACKFSSCCNKKPKLLLSDIKTEANLYFLSFNKNENGTPDYASLRAMCKEVKSLMDCDSVLCALPVASNLSDTTNELLQSLNVGVRRNLPFSLEDKLSGILIISTKEVKNGLFIGMIAPVRSEKSQEDITTSEENQII